MAGLNLSRKCVTVSRKSHAFVHAVDCLCETSNLHQLFVCVYVCGRVYVCVCMCACVHGCVCM